LVAGARIIEPGGAGRRRNDDREDAERGGVADPEGHGDEAGAVRGPPEDDAGDGDVGKEDVPKHDAEKLRDGQPAADARPGLAERREGLDGGDGEEDREDELATAVAGEQQPHDDE